MRLSLKMEVCRIARLLEHKNLWNVGRCIQLNCELIESTPMYIDLLISSFFSVSIWTA